MDRFDEKPSMVHMIRNHTPRIRPASKRTEQEPNPEEEEQPLPPPEIDGEEEAEPE